MFTMAREFLEKTDHWQRKKWAATKRSQGRKPAKKTWNTTETVLGMWWGQRTAVVSPPSGIQWHSAVFTPNHFIVCHGVEHQRG